MINFFKIGKNAASVSCEIYHTVHWPFIILSAYTAFCVRHFSTVAISKPTRSSISLSAVPFWLSFRAISFAFFTSPCSKPSAYWEASFCPGLKPFLLSRLSRDFPSLKLLNNKKRSELLVRQLRPFFSLLIPLRLWPSDRHSGQPYSSP